MKRIITLALVALLLAPVFTLEAAQKKTTRKRVVKPVTTTKELDNPAMDATAPCNTVAEPFSSFITKWCSTPSFRTERSKGLQMGWYDVETGNMEIYEGSDGKDIYDMVFSQYTPANWTDFFRPRHVETKKGSTLTDYEYMEWHCVSPEMMVYDYQEGYDLNTEAGCGSGLQLIFRFVGGRWMLAVINSVG